MRSIYEIDPEEIKMQKVRDIQNDKPETRKRKRKQETPNRLLPGSVPEELVTHKRKRAIKPKVSKESATVEEPVKLEAKPKVARKKVARKQEPSPSNSEVSVGDVEEVKPKKPRTEKQIAADIKRKEAARLKKEEQAAAKAKEEQDALLKEKKEHEKREKRKAAAAARKAAKESTEKTNETEDLPSWFRNYVKSVAKKEQQFVGEEEKPKVHKEVIETAKKQWNDGVVRDQLSDELSHHQRRMYAMIFPNRAGKF
jgi:hypothetical protein